MVRNEMTFQSKESLSMKVFHQVIYVYGEVWKLERVKKPIVVKNPNIDTSKTRGYFNGAIQGSLSIYGIGIILFMSKNHSISFKVVFVQGTNNKYELCALSMLLNISLDRGLASLNISRYFKLIIN
jgi:hypothetical protein